MQNLNRGNLKSEKSIDFCNELDNHNTDLNTLIGKSS